MGSLSNLYISQSYTSLIHLGNDGPITAVTPGQFIQLQDGLGNNLNIQVNSNGDLYLAGNLSASNIPIDIATQAELNAYTASTNIRLNNIETTTASLNTSVSQLNTWSSSAKISINALNAFTASNSFSASIVQLNQFTSSANIRLNNLESTSASVNISVANLNTFSSSAKVSINALNQFTASQSTASIVTSIANLNQATASLQSFSASTLTRLNNIETTTASLNSSVSQLNASSQSQQISIDNINQFTQSANVRLNNLESTSASVNVSISNINSATQSLQAQLATIGTQSGSWVTESETGSFARYDVSNPWSAPQTFTTITASAALITYLKTVYETSSVIYSSGSNQFGDASDDIQTLYGSVRVVNELTASGLHYPTADGLAGQYMITNGAGTLSFDDVHTMLEDVRYGENITIGDPLYVSGSSGNRPIVYKADASNPAKMPVIYIASSTGTTNTNTTAITLGLITGVTTSGYPAGTDIYVGEGGGWSASRPSGSNSIVQALGIVTKEGAGGSGRGLVLNPGPATLPNIQTGYVWVGNSGNQPVAFATASLVTNINTGSLVTTASFNQFTQSINAFTQSAQISINALNQFTSSVTASVNTGSLLLNAQANGVNTIQFTRGDASTFNVVMTVSSSAAAPQNTYTGIYSGSTWNVTHNLNTSTPLVFAYESSSQYTLPAALDVINQNQITLTWSRIVNGSIIVVNGGGGTSTYYGNISNQSTASITHNLDTLYPLVQFYESGSNAQAIPAQIISTNVNTTTLYFSNAVSGKVVIKK